MALGNAYQYTSTQRHHGLSTELSLLYHDQRPLQSFHGSPALPVHYQEGYRWEKYCAHQAQPSGSPGPVPTVQFPDLLYSSKTQWK